MTDPTTPESRAELRQLLDRTARSRPWAYLSPADTDDEDRVGIYWSPTNSERLVHDLASWYGADRDAELAVAAVNALPALLDALDQADDHAAFIESISDMNDMHAYQWQERAKAAEATLARVTEVINSPYWGTYWGEVMVPQPHLLRALGGDRP